MVKLNEMYDTHPMAEKTTIYQRARILNSAKHRFTELDTYDEIRQWFNDQIVEVAEQNTD